MKVYLVRHGDALANEIDPQNPLSERGEIQVKSLGEFLAPLNIQVSSIFHSGKLRAQQTAEILAKAIHYKGNVEARAGLHPLDLVSPIASEINQIDADTIYVGHMPFMGKLAAKLITSDEGADVILFQTSTIVCLERMGGNNWIVRWALCPELVM